MSGKLIGATSLVAWVLAVQPTGAGNWVHRLLTLTPVRYIGRISYSMYLIHVVVIVQSSYFIPFRFVLLPALAVIIGYASLSWHLMERPLLNIAARSRR